MRAPQVHNHPKLAAALEITHGVGAKLVPVTVVDYYPKGRGSTDCTPLDNGQTWEELEAGEREHFGDPDLCTGIYAPKGGR
jgi:hypothetical protein